VAGHNGKRGRGSAASWEAAATGGGTLTPVVRVGDTARRPTGPWSRAVHALLLHLEAVGFERAPRFLGIDDADREVLSFLPGTVADWPWPQVMLSNDGPRQAGVWLRDYHAAAGSFAPPEGAVWRDRSSGMAPSQLLLHGDPGPWNAVWSGGELQGFIDWDLAHPGDPTGEMLEALWHVVPLYDDGACREAGFREGCDRMRRTAVFLDAYGSDLRFPDERSVAKAVLAYARRQRERTLRLGAAGVEPWVTLSKRWPELHLKWRWLEEQAGQEPGAC
jgi:Phosphotransferase enzyme family